MADEIQAASSSDSGKGNKMVLIISVLNTLATIGVIVVLVLSYQKEKAKVTVDDIVAGRLKEGDGHGGGHGEKAKAAGGHGGGHGAGKDDEDAVAEGKVMPLDQFTINLSAGAGNNPRFIRINMSLEFEPGQTEEEPKAKLARIRDTIINILNSKRPADIAGHEGREVLKDEIKRSVNSFMAHTKVKNVYFTNFQISN